MPAMSWQEEMLTTASQNAPPVDQSILFARFNHWSLCHLVEEHMCVALSCMLSGRMPMPIRSQQGKV